jgi:FG-GAP-like repeat
MTSRLQRAVGTTAGKSILLVGIIAATIGISCGKSTAQADPGPTSITTINMSDAQVPAQPQVITSGGCHIMPPKTPTGESVADIIRPDCEIPMIPGGPVRNPDLPAGSCVQNNCNPMTYQGGPVITQTQHRFAFLNCTGGAANCFSNYGNANTNPFVFVSDFFSSNYIHALDQYMKPNVLKTSGRYQTNGNGVQITATVNHVIYDADVQSFIMTAINSFNPNGGGGGYNQMYSFFLPQGQDLCFGSSSNPSTSCYCPDLINPTCGNPAKWSFCGYHSSFNAVDVTGTTIHVIYQALPYANVTSNQGGCEVTNGPNGAQADSQNTLITHELAETITDPDTNAWFRGNTAGEIGDICNFIEQNPIYLHGRAYSVQQLYSNAVQNCVGAYATLALSHDFNFDMNSDLAWRNTNGDASIWLMTVTSGNAQILSAVDYGIVPNSWHIVGQRDFNGDGKADLLWSNTNGDTTIWLMNGTQVSSTTDLGIIGNGWSIVGTGDFNGDGFGDILWRNTNGDTSIWLMTWNGTQVQVLSATDFGVVPTSWSVAQTGDFNGDGKADILWHNTNGDTSIWLMTANGTQMQVLSATDLGVVPTSWKIAGTGDFNGDGKSDIIWHNTNGDTSIWLMTASGTQVQVSSTTDLGFVPTSWNVAGTGDFNSDGRSDILWSNTNGDTSIWFMNGTLVSSVSDLGVVPPSWGVQGAGAD